MPVDALSKPIPSSRAGSSPVPQGPGSLHDPVRATDSLDLPGCHWTEPLPHPSPLAALASLSAHTTRSWPVRGFLKGSRQLNQTGALTPARIPFSQVFVYLNLACPSNS